MIVHLHIAFSLFDVLQYRYDYEVTAVGVSLRAVYVTSVSAVVYWIQYTVKSRTRCTVYRRRGRTVRTVYVQYR